MYTVKRTILLIKQAVFFKCSAISLNWQSSLIVPADFFFFLGARSSYVVLSLHNVSKSCSASWHQYNGFYEQEALKNLYNFESMCQYSFKEQQLQKQCTDEADNHLLSI